MNHLLDGITIGQLFGWAKDIAILVFTAGYLVGRGDRSSRRDQGQRIGAGEKKSVELEQRLAALEASRKNG